MNPKISILFLCTGNICRSPTADAIMRALVDRDSIANRFIIDSAGTHGYHIGEKADHRTRAVAKQHGIAIDHLRARAFVDDDFSRFNWIFAMDRGHLEWLEQRKPAHSQTQLALFLSAANTAGSVVETEVPDPYYDNAAAFELVYDLCERGARALLHRFTTSS